MNAEAAIPVVSSRPRWRRRLSVGLRRSSLIAWVELAVALVLAATMIASYLIVSSRAAEETLVTPLLGAVLLIANLVPAMVLMVLFASRLALRRAMRLPTGGRGRLHVRLVVLFSVLASVPTLLVVIFASFLFQSGTEFWFSGRARGMIETASSIAAGSYHDELNRVNLEVVTMVGDLHGALGQVPADSPQFAEFLGRQLYVRNLSEAILFRETADHGVLSLALVNPYDRPLEQAIRPEQLRQLTGGRTSIAFQDSDRIASIVRFPGSSDIYIYGARVLQPQVIAQLSARSALLADYRTLQERSRTLQLRFNAILLVVSLLIVALAIFVALKLADRLVRPVGQLVDAARRITAGDLSARVPESNVRDEVGTLGSAFNRMSRRLEEQTSDLVTANAQLDSRRAFIEAVLSGVTAGVLSVGEDHVVRLVNSSAEALLRAGGKSLVGQKLADIAPELDRHLTAPEQEDVVQLTSMGEPRTLALKTVKVAGGYVLTFDDITEQLLDQRRAAWSDVARRIAHEIKNPLTPIQLAAERLQRRYGDEVTSDQPTFERLTGTIVRQVGDLRRMVDEFSSFARMPKPSFRLESLGEIARQALFLHEVAHSDIAFTLDVPDPAPTLVCDRRLLGQALTNVVKNGVEAIQQRLEEKKKRKAKDDQVSIDIREEGAKLIVEVADNGIGLPAERARITEPYMTTRTKGTGLGLAIVKKIIEEHFGQIEFADVPGGGSVVRMTFDRETLAGLSGGAGVKTEENIGTA